MACTLLHPDFIKGATSEQSLFLGIKLQLPRFSFNPLASQRSAWAKAKTFSQVMLRRAEAAGPYSAPERLRKKFKADMVDETSETEPCFQSLQPFGAPYVSADALAESFAPLTPPLSRARSPSPVEE